MEGQIILGIIALVMGIGGITLLEYAAIQKGINGKIMSTAFAAIAGMAGLAFGLGVGG